MINIVIAEDDYRVAQIHEAFLEKISDVNIVGKAKNAAETFDLLKEQQVDLLLLDIYMPDCLGSEILPEIRLRHPGIDIIMITAAKEKDFIRKAMDYGVFRYLIKPVQLEEFAQSIEQFKKKKNLLENDKDIDNESLQKLFSYSLKEEKNLPTGIDSLTLRKVSKLIESHPGGLSSEVVGHKMGASRTTARRYLEYLVGTGQVKAESVYGIVGRPERNYYPVIDR